MAVLIPKPFNILEKIKTRIFGGNPKILADVDINQLQDIQDYNSDKLHEQIGAFAKNFRTNVTVFQNGGGDYQADVEILAGGKLFFKGVEFDLPAQALTSYFISNSVPQTDSVGKLYLIATKTTIDFPADNVMAGIDGVGFPGPLASSDAVVYSNERFDWVWGIGNLPTLGANEEVICIIGQAIWEEMDGDQAEPYWVQTVLDITDVPYYLDLPKTSFPGGVDPTYTGAYGDRNLHEDDMSLTANFSFLMRNTKRVIIDLYDTCYNKIFQWLSQKEMQYFKTQEWSQGTNITLVSGNQDLVITPTGNTFKVTFPTTNPGATITDIKIDRGAGPVALPAGTVLFLNCVQPNTLFPGKFSGAGTFVSNFAQWSNPWLPNKLEIRQLGVTNGDFIIAIKHSTHWRLVLDRSDDIALYYDQMVQLLQDGIDAINLPIQSFWRVLGTGPYPWQTAGLSGGLTGYDMRYTKDGLNDVIIEGSFFNSTGATFANIYTLPVGYRPSNDIFVPLFNGSILPTATTSVPNMKITTAGQISFQGTVNNQAYYFAPFRFRAV